MSPPSSKNLAVHLVGAFVHCIAPSRRENDAVATNRFVERQFASRGGTST